jgi:hypothetical protein
VADSKPKKRKRKPLVLIQVEIGEIASIHALFAHVAEKIIGCSNKLDEYPTPSGRQHWSAVLPELFRAVAG